MLCIIILYWDGGELVARDKIIVNLLYTLKKS